MSYSRSAAHAPLLPKEGLGVVGAALRPIFASIVKNGVVYALPMLFVKG